MELLRHTPPLTLKEIGNAVGYEDPYYLSRVFKSMTGTSPSEYRNRADDEIGK
ncbi:putative DNA-binding response regulator [Paenibacillus agaridevorans]|uniref:Putative DNA-binding response regulator n=1 Tax=Paenibacillus agaridevorans TaxID=171404 RepID=A0A2R5ETL2_9BACL|nr:putative DNA-binding response regulator [Paenibacillus agaridevorans]